MPGEVNDKSHWSLLSGVCVREVKDPTQGNGKTVMDSLTVEMEFLNESSAQYPSRTLLSNYPDPDPEDDEDDYEVDEDENEDNDDDKMMKMTS